MNAEQLKRLENDLWSAADSLRANTGLKSSEYATPILGLIFLRFADNKYQHYEAAIQAEFERLQTSSRLAAKPIHEIALQQCGFYLPPEARYEHLLTLPEDADMVKSVQAAMQAIEQYKPELSGILPKEEYQAFVKTDKPELKRVLFDLIKKFSDIPRDASGDVFGKIYEYFLGKFALSEGQKGGEFFTPTSVVKLMVEIIEPYEGSVFDPACGSGGMFVQSQAFVQRHRKANKNKSSAELVVYGQEKTLDTVKLAKMNLAVNGLRGEITEANSYQDDVYQSFGRFDYVMANPPFNVDDVPVSTVENDQRFNTYGLPRNKTKVAKGKNPANDAKETIPNANYLWINLFATSLKDKGRAALVMANSASDARHSEADIRQKLVEENLIYGMLTLPSNMFYTVTLPATLWFFDKAKTNRKILFIDARNIFTQIDRAHREFSEAQIQNIAVISKLHRGDRAAFMALVDGYFTEGWAAIVAHKAQVDEVCEQVLAVLKEEKGQTAVNDFKAAWQALPDLEKRYQAYVDATENGKADEAGLDAMNQQQQALRAAFEPFFAGLHAGLKALDKVMREHEKARVAEAEKAGKRASLDKETRQLKAALEQLHREVKAVELCYAHIGWLQARFPQAVYEDVTGLCKLASVEEVREQDYSLNAGRYVGVVIEEDGKTEEEFLAELAAMNEELKLLTAQSEEISEKINLNINSLIKVLLENE
ncbi:type I restriction-modification system subunit M [Candidatus Thiothrix anitrata]|uniref:site-specific DNA-methyltransferase (adenine-specific) n=1 Tax=Candidatus Thiothrix anitrata TaxID=2823902 RepID=A0ABX7X6M9_9GAMM|nr:class I SAM-dependent DNA methyltransferase [Candidatus Thiothrix anitrata]QTR50957.1 N-6 DNA methylase [Candidatus Thiothrix anitrata]